MTLLLLGLFGGLFHLGGSQVRSFERAAAVDIASKLQGDTKQVTVRADVGPEGLFGDIHSVRIDAAHFSTDGLPLYTESKRSHRGIVRSLHIDLEDFTLRDLRITRLSADISDCRFDFPLAVNHRQMRLSRSGTGLGEVVIGEKDLERFILAKFQEIKRVTVKIDRDKVFVEGHGEFLVVSTDFSVVSKLEAEGGDKLTLTNARILFDGHPVDETSQKLLLETLNPVVDLNKDLSLYGAIYVTKITLRDGQLIATGPITIPELPKEKVAPTGTKLRSEALLQQ